MDSRQQQKKRRFFVLCLLVVIFGYVIYVFAGGYLEVRQARQEAEELKAELAEERRMKRKLEEKLEALESEEYLEQLAREKLGLVREGEVLIRPVYKEDEPGGE